MDTSTYDETIYAMRDVIYRDYPFAIVREKLLELSVGEENIAFIDTICSELGHVCLQPLSKIVNRATMIIAQLATKGGTQITLRMCQKDFQDCLMYTLRRLTTKLGNLLTMHPEVWADIETRVLNLYSFWHQKFGNQDGKYFHALERYRMLRQSISFPSYNPYIQNIQKKTETKPPVCLAMLGDVKELIDWCNSQISSHNLVDIMNTACVRNIKSRSQQLHKIWTTQQLVGEEKEKVKDYYSQLRKLSKFIDAQNEKKKGEEEKKYLQTKKHKFQSQPSKIMSPTKVVPSAANTQSIDLLHQTKEIEEVKVPYTDLVETSLIDTSDSPLPKRVLKPIDLEKQLMEVFSSQDEITSNKALQSPRKEAEQQFGEFNMYTTAIPSQEEIPAVTLINEEIESPLKQKKHEELIDLI